MSNVQMDVLNTLAQENRAFAEKLEEEMIRGQEVEKMLVNAQKVMTEKTQEIQDLKRQLSLKESNLHQAEREISMMKRTYDGSAQDNMSLVNFGSQADELKPRSLRGMEEHKDKDREVNVQLNSLKQEIRLLREENQSLQALFVNSENGNKLLKESFSQTGIIRLQGELQGLQRLQLIDMVPDSLHSELKSPEERQLDLEEPFLWLPLLETHGSEFSSSSSSASQCRAEKQPLSRATTPEDCLSVRSFTSRLSEYRWADHGTLPKNQAQGRESTGLQKRLSEAQLLITEMDTCIQDSFQTRLQEDSLTRAVIESLLQQNRAIGQELGVQMARVREMEVMLTEAYEQKAIAVSKSQTAVEELQDFIRGRDKLLQELSEDYSLLKEEKTRLQSLFCDDGRGNAGLKNSFHPSQPQINKMQGELQDFQRQQCPSSQVKLQLGLIADEEREPGPEGSGFGHFLGGMLDEQHQNSSAQSGPVDAEGAAHLSKEYMTKKYKV